ncbi:MAG TPA: BTAD domain-containing putative transcriptional regulator [Clostridia bacterium]|nr:BTAD domain-containing putative transcriptional regulator [Clostridia bacterium]
MLGGEELEVGAHSLTAVLAVWLGLVVVTRSRLPAARIFALVAFAIAAWSSSIIVRILTTSPDVATIGHAVEEIAAAIAIPAVAHLSLAIATEGHPDRRLLGIVGITYLVSLAFTVPKLVDPAINPPGMLLEPFPAPLFGLGWVVSRLGPLLLAAVWLLGVAREAEPGSLRERQLRAALATVLTGAVGAALRVLPVIGEGPAWIGVSLVAVAIVLAAYTVFAAGIFLGPSVASRAFWTSLVGGLVLFALAAVVLVVEAASRSITGLDLPIFAVLATVVAIAIYEPVATAIRDAVGEEGPRAAARRRLLGAIGQSTFASGPADAGVQPALERLVRTLDLGPVLVLDQAGAVVAAHGTFAPPDGGEVPVAMALVTEGETVGELRIGPRSSGRPLSSRDQELLSSSAAYMAAALRTGRREDAHVDSLVGLSAQRADVERRATELHAALVQHETRPAGLRVHALGPLRVERDGAPIERWGGDKAGSRQAEALFAFLLDRGERGVGKDEALELIWPDTDLERGDLAFHRTMVGLRQTLEPERGRGPSQVVRFRNDRYRLDPTVVAWSDVDAFQSTLEAARRAASADERHRLLEEARGFYRGDYLDDCPFYGDSSHVETRREQLRDRFVDLLVVLAEGYEARGDRASAAAAFRDAIQASGDGSQAAEAGLARLGF